MDAKHFKMDEELQEIIEGLTRYTGVFPKEAVDAAVTRLPDLMPHLIDILRAAVEQPQVVLEDDDNMLHLFAMLLLAQARETKAYGVMVQLARLPENQLDGLVGDSVTEDLGSCLASVFDGDPGLIQELISDRKAGEYARGVGLSSLVILMDGGKVSREWLVDYFMSLFRGGLEREHSNVWDELASNSVDIYPEELLDDIRAAFQAGLIDPGYIDMRCVDEAMKGSRDTWLARGESHRKIRGRVIVKEMSSWACFQVDNEVDVKGREDTFEVNDDYVHENFVSNSTGMIVPFHREGAKVGRNDPCPCGSGKKYKKCCDL